jgi:hypothetical protein
MIDRLIHKCKSWVKPTKFGSPTQKEFQLQWVGAFYFKLLMHKGNIYIRGQIADVMM